MSVDPNKELHYDWNIKLELEKKQWNLKLQTAQAAIQNTEER